MPNFFQVELFYFHFYQLHIPYYNNVEYPTLYIDSSISHDEYYLCANLWIWCYFAYVDSFLDFMFTYMSMMQIYIHFLFQNFMYNQLHFHQWHVDSWLVPF